VQKKNVRVLAMSPISFLVFRIFIKLTGVSLACSNGRYIGSVNIFF
jgi:hypothetical protein